MSGGDRRVRRQVGEHRIDEGGLGVCASAMSIDVEVTVGTDPRAIGPMYIDAERRRFIHHRAAFSLAKARARWLS